MLEARGVTYAYPGARTPLYRDFDLAVGPDERVAISAPSGFGKTTLCRMLAGYDRPQKGEILVDGAPLPKRGMCPVQLILQHPETAVDPRMRMSQTLAEAGEVPQRLLDDLGYGFSLTQDIQGEPVAADGMYRLQVDAGLERIYLVQPGLFHGAELQAMAEADWTVPGALSAAKRLMRQALAVHLAGKPLASRELFRKP